MELSICLYTFWIYLYQWLLYQCSLHITSDLYTLLDDYFGFDITGYQWPQLSLCLCHIHGDKRMCQKVIHYTTHSLQTIRKSSTQTSNYGLFHLDRSISSYIIALGIWRTITDKPYRRSQAGQQLFHKIHSKISQKRTMSSTERGLGTQILNLIRIKLKNTTLTRPNLTISHVNAHSVNNKVGTLQSIITERNLDICAITETWLKLEDDDLTIKQIPPNGYNIISYPIPNGCMGGCSPNLHG